MSEIINIQHNCTHCELRHEGLQDCNKYYLLDDCPTEELDNYISHLTEDEKDVLFILSVLIFMKFGGKEEWIMDMIEFNKKTEELEEVANKYGLTVNLIRQNKN